MRNFGIKSKQKHQIIGIVLLFVSLIILLVNTTIAWFKDESISSNGDLKITLIGTLSLDVTANFNFYNLALAPDRVYLTDMLDQDIGTYIKTSDSHDIEGAYVRIKFETTRRNEGDSEFRDNSDLLKLYFGEGDDYNITTQTSYDPSDDKPKWFYNEADGYYYYIGAVEDEPIVFNKGYITSNKMTNLEKNAEVRINMIVESIQRQYGAYESVWGNDLPSIFTEWAEADEEAEWGQAQISND